MFNQELVLISLYSLNIIAITFTYWNVGNQNSLACTISLKNQHRKPLRDKCTSVSSHYIGRRSRSAELQTAFKASLSGSDVKEDVNFHWQ